MSSTNPSRSPFVDGSVLTAFACVQGVHETRSRSASRVQRPRDGTQERIVWTDSNDLGRPAHVPLVDGPDAAQGRQVDVCRFESNARGQSSPFVRFVSTRRKPELTTPTIQASKLLVIDGLNIDPNEYAEVSARFLSDLNDLSTKLVMHFPAHWTIKTSS